MEALSVVWMAVHWAVLRVETTVVMEAWSVAVMAVETVAG